jgi:hypothetical protein
MSVGFTDRRGLEPQTQTDRKRPIELVLTRVGSSDKALRVRDAAGTVAWLPRQHLSDVEEGMFDQVRLTLPAWLAEEKHLVAAASVDQKTLF